MERQVLIRRWFAWLTGAAGVILVTQSGLWLLGNHRAAGQLAAAGTVLLAGGLALGLVVLRRTVSAYTAELERTVRFRAQAELVAALRGQRHDYANHLQVLSGLAQLGKTERLLAYVQQVAGESAALSRIGGVKPREIATALQAAAYQAALRQVPVGFAIESDWSGFGLDALRVGRYLDGVMELLIRLQAEAGETATGLQVSLSETAADYLFAVNGRADILHRLSNLRLPPEGLNDQGQSAADCLQHDFGGRIVVDGEGDRTGLIWHFPKPAGAQCVPVKGQATTAPLS